MASETIFCPACNNKLRVPDDLMGQEVQCPKCQRMFTAPPPPTTSIRPADQAEASPRPMPIRPSNGFEEDEDRWDVERRQQPGPNPMPPGIFLAVAALLGVLVNLGDIALTVFFPNFFKQAVANNPFGGAAGGVDIGAIKVVMSVVCLLVSLVSLTGAVAMIRRRVWWLAIVGCFVAIFNVNEFCCLLGAPAGIWGLIVLFNENTRRTFQ